MKKIILVSLLTASMVGAVFAAKSGSDLSSRTPSVASVLSFSVGKEGKIRTCTFFASARRGEAGHWGCDGYASPSLAPIIIRNSDESVVTCTASSSVWACG